MGWPATLRGPGIEMLSTRVRALSVSSQLLRAGSNNPERRRRGGGEKTSLLRTSDLHPLRTFTTRAQKYIRSNYRIVLSFVVDIVFFGTSTFLKRRPKSCVDLITCVDRIDPHFTTKPSE